MPHKDPEQRKAANRARMQKRRAEGAWLDPEKERERKQQWYAAGGKEKIRAAERIRRGQAREEKISKINEG